MFTLDAAVFGETRTPTEMERKLISELKQLTKQYPVTVITCGGKSNQVQSLSGNCNRSTVSDLVVTVSREHVTVM